MPPEGKVIVPLREIRRAIEDLNRQYAQNQPRGRQGESRPSAVPYTILPSPLISSCSI
jgi:hypothetical protein